MSLAIVGKKPWKARNKYGAQRTTIQGIHFDSKKEALRWIVLNQMQRDGDISGLQRQVPYDLNVNDQHICKYIADFTYMDNRGAGFTTEDAKGVQTDVFKIKAKLFKAIFGREILVT